MLLGARLGSFGGGAAPLFDAEIDYLQTDGASWLYSPRSITSSDLASNIEIKMTAEFPNGGSNAGIIAQGSTPYATPWCVTCLSTVGNIKLFSNGKFQKNFTGLDSKKEMTLELSSVTAYLTVGTSRQGGTYSTSYQLGERMTIFSFDSGGYPAPNGGKLYAFSMMIGDELVVDGIPVRVGQVGYMYDRVSGELFGNSGTGAFILGPDK